MANVFPRKAAEEDAYGKYEDGSVAGHLAVHRHARIIVHGGRYKAVEQAHEYAAGQRQHQAFATPSARGASGQTPVGDRIEDDCQYNQQHAKTEQTHVAHRIGCVVEDHTDQQRQADAHGKRDRHAGNLDGRHQQNIRQIEYRTTEQRRPPAAG